MRSKSGSTSSFLIVSGPGPYPVRTRISIVYQCGAADDRDGDQRTNGHRSERAAHATFRLKTPGRSQSRHIMPDAQERGIFMLPPMHLNLFWTGVNIF